MSVAQELATPTTSTTAGSTTGDSSATRSPAARKRLEFHADDDDGDDSPTPPKRMRLNTLPSISFGSDASNATPRTSPEAHLGLHDCSCIYLVSEKLCHLQEKMKVKRATDLSNEQKDEIANMSSPQASKSHV